MRARHRIGYRLLRGAEIEAPYHVSVHAPLPYSWRFGACLTAASGLAVGGAIWHSVILAALAVSVMGFACPGEVSTRVHGIAKRRL
jgi:hypothetical protein